MLPSSFSIKIRQNTITFMESSKKYKESPFSFTFLITGHCQMAGCEAVVCTYLAQSDQ